MLAAVGQKVDFSGVKRSGNTPAVLPQRATPKIPFLSTALWVAVIMKPEASLALHLQPAAGMLTQSRLACGLFLLQRPLWDFISDSGIHATISG